MLMRRWLVTGANILFGVVPATFLLLWVLVLVFAALAGPPADIDATIVPWKVTAFFLAAVAGVVGYVALIFTARGVKTRRVIVGLFIGIAANAYAIPLAWDLNSYAMRQWFNWYWFVSPIVVALVHVVAYFAGGRRHDIQSRPTSA